MRCGLSYVEDRLTCTKRLCRWTMNIQAQEDAPTRIDGTIEGLTPGSHAISVHTFGDFSQGLTSAGGIFNPFGKNHGAPDDEERMAGDLGNVEVDATGRCTVHFEVFPRLFNYFQKKILFESRCFAFVSVALAVLCGLPTLSCKGRAVVCV